MYTSSFLSAVLFELIVCTWYNPILFQSYSSISAPCPSPSHPTSTSVLSEKVKYILESQLSHYYVHGTLELHISYLYTWSEAHVYCNFVSASRQRCACIVVWMDVVQQM